MSTIKEQSEILANLNAAIQRVAKKSGSKIIRNLKMVQKLETNSADYVFTGVLDTWGWFYVSGAEVSHQYGEDKKMDALVRAKAKNTLSSMICLLEDELEILGKGG